MTAVTKSVPIYTKANLRIKNPACGKIYRVDGELYVYLRNGQFRKVTM